MRRTILLGLACALAAAAVVLPATHGSGAASPTADAITVYATRTGACYHVEGCPSLQHSAIPLSLAEAAARGLRPCQRCSPPLLGENEPRVPPAAPEPERLLPATLVRIIDGDTIRVLVQGREEAVRLIGVDTPEITRGKNEPFGEAAKEFLAAMLANRRLALEPGVEERDRYGRLLAYLWTQGEQDGAPVFANAQLLRWGYAQLLTIPPNVKYVERFRSAQAAARREALNLWRP
jgi:micrococcal nuclease